MDSKPQQDRSAREPIRRRLPDKWLAAGLFLFLFFMYLWRHDDAIKQMMFTAFGLLCVAISDGVAPSVGLVKNRLAARGDYKQPRNDAEKK